MTHMLIRHKVADFDTWNPVYEDHRKVRQAAGLRDLHLWRNADDPNEVYIIFEASNLAKAKEFARSTDLKEKMQAAGVQGKPDIEFLTDS